MRQVGDSVSATLRQKRGSAVRQLGDLEAAVMEHLWSAGSPLTVRDDVLTRLDRQPPLAYTVLTVINNLHRKGFLEREREGRAFRYHPTKDRAQHTADVMHELLSDSGDSAVTLLRFVDRMSPDEVARLKQVLDE